MRVTTSLCCAVALAGLLGTSARADETDRLTYMTFSGPVQVPGVTLAAGTYTFKMADSSSSRHVVQIFNKDDNKIITQVMTIPNERLEPVKDTFVMFQERPAGVPVAVKAWFYPGRSIGEEFLYPKQQALKIAKASGETVLSSEGEVADAKAKVTRVTSTADQAAAAATTTSTRATTTARATTAPTTTARAEAPTTTARTAAPTTTVGTAGQATPAPVATTARNLPRTASPLALFELLSGLSLAGGLALRRLRKQL